MKAALPLPRFATVAATLFLLSCATAPSRPAAAPPAGVSPPSETKFASALEAEASVLKLEDERRFDGPTLEAAAKRSETGIRIRVAHAVGSIGDPRGLPILAALVSDRDSNVRAAAALGEEILGDSSALPAVSTLLQQQDVTVVCAAARAVARLRQPGSEKLLIDASRTAPPAARPCVFYALAGFATEPAATAAEIAAASSSGELRRAAIYAFSRNPIASSSAALSSALRDPDPDSAAFAARALGVLGAVGAVGAVGSPDGVSALAAALDRRDPGLLANALTALEQIEAKQAVSLPPDRIARIVALAADADPNVALPALVLLRRFTDDRDVIRTLDGQATAGVGRRREVALVSLAQGLREKSKTRLEAAMDSTDPGLRAAAAEGLAGLNEAFAASYRPRLLADPSPHVREIALDAMTADAAHLGAIRAMLSDPDAGVRSAAIDRLADTGDPSVVADLEPALVASRRDSIPDTAISAVSAAARFRSEAARAVITAALSDPRPLISRFARQQLIDVFQANPAAIPAPVFVPGRTIQDYERILENAGRPRKATIRTSRGDIVIALDGVDTPLTVENFAVLAGRRFFDGSTFDRVVPNFVVQGGDPTATQHGGPGYEIRDELAPGSYGRGSVGMALGGADTGGSQFFITLSPQPHLDGKYPLFGRVVSGQETVERIEQGDRVISIVVAGGP